MSSAPKQSFELSIYAPEGCGEVVVASASRVKSGIERMRQGAKDARKKANDLGRAKPKPEDVKAVKAQIDGYIAEADSLEAAAARLEDADVRLREKLSGKLTTVSIPFRPYTDGEKQDARAEATQYVDGAPRIDIDTYHRILTAACTGIGMDELRNMPPARREAITREVIERSEPDPARLDFLS